MSWIEEKYKYGTVWKSIDIEKCQWIEIWDHDKEEELFNKLLSISDKFKKKFNDIKKEQ